MLPPPDDDPHYWRDINEEWARRARLSRLRAEHSESASVSPREGVPASSQTGVPVNIVNMNTGSFLNASQHDGPR